MIDKILIIGTGAIGSLYGAKLQQAGAQVSVLCRSDYEIVKKKGIIVRSHWGDMHFIPEKTIKSCQELKDFPDYILLTTKALPNIDYKALMQDAIGPATSIIILQNGIDIERPIFNVFPKNEIISGLAFVCVSRIKPGIVHHQDYGRLVFGLFPHGTASSVKTLCKLFQKAKVVCEEDSNIARSRWKKMIWNTPFNPISVLAGSVTTDIILSNEQTKKLVLKVMQEVCDVAKSCGYPLKPQIIQSNIDATLKMTPYKTSMLLDFENKRKMEVEAILGNFVRIAQEQKIPIPYSETMYSLLHCINSQY